MAGRRNTKQIRIKDKGHTTTFSLQHVPTIPISKYGWEARHCDVHNGPFHGKPYILKDGRVACPSCWCTPSTFQPKLTLNVGQPS